MLSTAIWFWKDWLVKQKANRKPQQIPPRASLFSNKNHSQIICRMRVLPALHVHHLDCNVLVWRADAPPPLLLVARTHYFNKFLERSDEGKGGGDGGGSSGVCVAEVVAAAGITNNVKM
jgi:hypothetical protein